MNSLFIKRENNQNQPENNQNSPGIQQEPTRNQSEIARKPPGIEKNCVVFWMMSDDFLMSFWWVLVGFGRFITYELFYLKANAIPLKCIKYIKKRNIRCIRQI